jgi:hypothetical protein
MGENKMNFKTQSILVVFLLVCHAVICQESEGQILKLKFDLPKTGPVKMSELFSEITYIPLETNPNCLIGYMNIEFFGKDWLIRSNTGGPKIYRFSDKGRFINQIGNEGRGPDEYLDNTDIMIIEDTVFVLSNFSREIICYSLNGNFLSRYKLATEARPKSIVQLKDKSFLISLSNPSELGNIIKTDKDFKILSGMMPHVPLTSNPLPHSFRKSSGRIYYYYNYIDTIYEVSRGYLIPSILVDYGKYKTAQHNDNPVLSKPSIRDFRISDYYYQVSIYYPFNNSSYTTLYRIRDGKQFTWTKLINDIDNGTIDRWYGSIEDNNFVFVLMASTIISRLSEMTKAEKLDPKNSGFVKMAEKVTPDSNPVIMICKIK